MEHKASRNEKIPGKAFVWRLQIFLQRKSGMAMSTWRQRWKYSMSRSYEVMSLWPVWRQNKNSAGLLCFNGTVESHGNPWSTRIPGGFSWPKLPSNMGQLELDGSGCSLTVDESTNAHSVYKEIPKEYLKLPLTRLREEILDEAENVQEVSWMHETHKQDAATCRDAGGRSCCCQAREKGNGAIQFLDLRAIIKAEYPNT